MTSHPIAADDVHWIAIPPLDADERHPLHRARWIGPPQGAAGALFALRRTFVLPDRPIASAQLHLWVDGRPYNDPGFAIPEGWAFCRINGASEAPLGVLNRLLELRAPLTADIAGLLRPGSNRIALLSWLRLPEASAIALIEVSYADGATVRIATDASWTSQVLDVADAAQARWEEQDAGQMPAAERCAFGAEPWADVRATLDTVQPAQVLCRKFTLPDRAIAAARLEATAIGTYAMELNGTAVGVDRLAPGWTDTRCRVEVQAHDVTQLVRPGANTWLATVARGWAGSVMQGCISLREPGAAMRAVLTVDFTDGSRQVVATDADGWTGWTGAVRESTIYGGETVDATVVPIERPVRILPRRPIALVPELAAQARVVDELAPVAITRRGDDRWVVDFGQNFAGVVRLRLDAPRGTRVTLRHAELLRRDGSLMVCNLNSAAACDRLVCPGGPYVFEPRFTVHGFRYVEIAGLSHAPSHDDVRGLVISSCHRQTLHLTCDHRVLDGLFEMIRWTQLSNWLSVPSDCPQRSERLGWLGDNHVFAPAGLLMYDGAAFQAKHLADIYDAAHPQGGLPDFAPCGGGAGPIATYGWADAGVSVPHAIWRTTGDLGPARRHWSGIRAYLRHRDASADPEGLNVHGGYGDWLTLDAPTPHAVLGPIHHAQAHAQAAELAQALGDTAACHEHRRRFAEIRDVWCRRHLRPDGTITSETQTAYVCAWKAGLIPEAMRPAVARALAAACDRAGGHNHCGLLGTAALIEVLVEAGLRDHAWMILTRTDFPSYGYFLERGMTTMPEWWDAFPGQEIVSYWKHFTGDRSQGDCKSSLNHPAFCSVLAGIVACVWGLRQARGSAGYRSVVIAPQFIDRLPRVAGEFQSVAGTWSLRYARSDAGVRFTGTVPPGCTARIELPGIAPRALEQGVFRIDLPCAADNSYQFIQGAALRV